MKALVVGGMGQGKLAYVLNSLELGQDAVVFGETCALDEIGAKPVLTGLESLIRRFSGAGLLEKLEALPCWVVICREVGCGVVPINAEERQWREEVGRICCDLAVRADSVIRVCCGLPATVKGEPL